MSLEREREREGKKEREREREGGSERVERREKMVDSRVYISMHVVCHTHKSSTNQKTKQKITKQLIRHQFIKFPQPKLSA